WSRRARKHSSNSVSVMPPASARPASPRRSRRTSEKGPSAMRPPPLAPPLSLLLHERGRPTRFSFRFFHLRGWCRGRMGTDRPREAATAIEVPFGHSNSQRGVPGRLLWRATLPDNRSSCFRKDERPREEPLRVCCTFLIWGRFRLARRRRVVSRPKYLATQCPRVYNHEGFCTDEDPGEKVLPMLSPGSVTDWIGQLKAGDPAAAQKLWERYFQRLVGLARKKLQGTPRRAADEEDVALSAFASLCRRVAAGQFPQLRDREDLWHLLLVITARKALNQIRHERRQKRGGTLLPQGVVPRIDPDAE